MFQGNGPSGSGEADILRFLPNMDLQSSWSYDLDQTYKLFSNLAEIV